MRRRTLPPKNPPTQEEQYLYVLAVEEQQALAERTLQKAAHARSRAQMLPEEVMAVLERQAWRERWLIRARQVRAQGRRFATICGRWQGRRRVPDLRLSGLWLRQAGFDLGQHFEIDIEPGRLTIRSVD
jgi:hypothetical protein